MRIIETLSDKIEEELCDAKDYAMLALEQREERPQLAQAFYDLSTDELRHMGILHTEVVKLIEDYRRANGEPPADMLARYEYLHGRHIKKAAEVKSLQAMFRER